jgi:2-iminobutanoate/2-iminopropanoate deaminase
LDYLQNGKNLLSRLLWLIYQTGKGDWNCNSEFEIIGFRLLFLSFLIIFRTSKTEIKPMKRREILKGLSVIPLAGIATAAIAKHHAGTEAGAVAEAAEEWLPKKELIKTPAGSCLRSGHLLFIGGIGGWYANQRAEPGDIQVQIRSVLTTMKGILEGAGSSMSNVLKIQMTVAEPNKNMAKLNEAYAEFFPENPPVRSYSGSKTSQMGREGILCQVACIAYVD